MSTIFTKIINKEIPADILFEKKIFKKEKSVYASFKLQQDTFWGRKIRYSALACRKRTLLTKFKRAYFLLAYG